jgi:hypothetical protein
MVEGRYLGEDRVKKPELPDGIHYGHADLIPGYLPENPIISVATS